MNPTQAERLMVAFVGHVDHGKSTVLGRLLADGGLLPDGKLQQIADYCERNARPFEYAFLIDALSDERSQNITIDAARVFFKTPRRHYEMIDAPGHIEFIRNMITGAARADAAVLVMDAQEGVQENSRRHGYLLHLLGVRQVIVIINKMDLVDFNPERFEILKETFCGYLESVGVQAHAVIPVSAREGDQVVNRGLHMPWYTGPTLLECLDHLSKPAEAAELPFRMAVQDIYRFTRFGDGRRIIAGQVSSGRLEQGDELIFYPSEKRARVRSLETFPSGGRESVESGEPVSLVLEPQIYLRRGELAAHPQHPPITGDRLKVSLLWLGQKPLHQGQTCLLKLGTSRVKARLQTVMRVFDSADVLHGMEKSQVESNEIAECVLELNRPLAFDCAEDFTDTRRFVLVDNYQICGGGIILENLPSAENSWLRSTVAQRGQKWVGGRLTMETRAERYGQTPCLVIITGRKGLGRKRLAAALETRLFNDGGLVYYMGIGSLRAGVDADLKQSQDPEERREHIRRMAEVAHLFLDAGMILIVTAVELSHADLQIIHTVTGADMTRVVWVGEKTTDLNEDLWLPDDIDDAEAAAQQVQNWLA
ncbi:MAG TPA: GTP-binding protein [Anaerolineaceae bacterium]|nr:GTP-binding protein [Anaerolineaceae bacterium]HPN51787.1 GTP-binding protein [Anaerolineaceae bacterium]